MLKDRTSFQFTTIIFYICENIKSNNYENQLYPDIGTMPKHKRLCKQKENKDCLYVFR